MKIETRKKLNYMLATKKAIRDALIAQGQNVTDADTFRSYADKILAITPVSKISFRYCTTLYPSDGLTSFDANYGILSNDGKYFQNSGRVYDVYNGTVKWTAKDENGNVLALRHSSFNPSGDAVYAARQASSTKVEIIKLTADSIEAVANYTASTSAFTPQCVVCSPDVDGELYISYLAQEGTNYLQRTLFIINGNEVKDSAGTSILYNGFLFTNDGQYVVGYGNNIQRFKRETGAKFGNALITPGTIANFSLTADNNYVVNTTGGTSGGEPVPIIAVWRVSDYQKMYDLQDFVAEQGYAICIPNTNVVVYCYFDGRGIRAWNLTSGSPTEMTDLPSPTQQFGNNVRVIFSGSGNRIAFVNAGFVDVWDVVRE